MSEIRNLTRNGETFYPLTTSSAVINESTGEGMIIDDVPLGESNNLCKSGGINNNNHICNFIGKGGTFTWIEPDWLVPNRKYRIYILDYNGSDVPTAFDGWRFRVSYDVAGGQEIGLVGVRVQDPAGMPDYLDFTMPSAYDNLYIGGRANSGFVVRMLIEDITAEKEANALSQAKGIQIYGDFSHINFVIEKGAAEGDTESLYITKITLYIRGNGVNFTANNVLISDNSFGLPTTQSPSGEVSVKIPDENDLVYDAGTSSLKIVSRGNVKAEYLVILANVGGAIKTCSTIGYGAIGGGNIGDKEIYKCHLNDDAEKYINNANFRLGTCYIGNDKILPNVDTTNGFVDFGDSINFIAKGKRYNGGVSDFPRLVSDGRFKCFFKDGTNLSLSSIVYLFIDLNTMTFKPFGQDLISYITGDMVCIGVVNCNFGQTYSSFVHFDAPYEFTINNSKIGPNILDINPPYIIEPKLKNLNQRLRDGNFVLQAKQFTLLHFSDIHADGVNLSRIIEFNNRYATYINDIIHTGDSVYDLMTDGMQFWNDVNGAEKILNVLGNHDMRISNGSGGWTDSTDLPAIYSQCIGNYKDNWGGIVQPANAATLGLCYYYKDYSDPGIRLIVLDCMHQTADQDTWLTSVLTDAKTKGYAVIIAEHYPIGHMPFEMSFNNFFYSQAWYNEDAANFVNAKDIVDDFINGGGEFVCWMCGHDHYDMLGTVINHPKQIMYLVGTAGLNHAGWNIEERIAGDISQDNFNIFAVDRYTKTFRVLKVGVKYDRYLRHKESFCIDYKNCKLLGEY